MDKAQAAANYVRHFLTEGHHGAYEQGDHIIVYGVDHYSTDARARRAVEMMRKVVTEYHITDCAFGVSDDGVAWVLVAMPDANLIVDPEDLHLEVWSCWFSACEEQNEGGDKCYS